MQNSNLGLVHVYTGNGKGKTTAALGLAFRASGHGFRVCVIQFMKGGKHIGELEASKRIPNIEIMQFGKTCPYSEKMKKGATECDNCRYCFMSREEEEEKAKEALEYARKAASSGDYNIVILDEVNTAIDKGFLNAKPVLDLIKKKKPRTELVLTGRGAPKNIIDKADVVTEMREIKHPMKKGVFGRRGIEY